MRQEYKSDKSGGKERKDKQGKKMGNSTDIGAQGQNRGLWCCEAATTPPKVQEDKLGVVRFDIKR